jgi:transcriptional regulator with XRE-family HTH domain
MMKAEWKKFGSALRDLRERKQLGVRELARRANVSHTLLSRLERGEAPPPAAKKLKAIGKALGCDEKQLFALSGRLPSNVTAVLKREECLRLIEELEDLPDNDVTFLRQVAVGLRLRIAATEMKAVSERLDAERRQNPEGWAETTQSRLQLNSIGQKPRKRAVRTSNK